jgi:hypothetical protein
VARSPIPETSWHAIGTGAGGSDILFQNTGQVSVWDMDGTTRTGGGAVSPNAGRAGEWSGWADAEQPEAMPGTQDFAGYRIFLA